MLAQLLEGKKKLKAKISSKKSKGKRKEGDSSSSVHSKEEEQSNSESSKSPSEEGGNSENESTHSKRMNKLEQRLEVLEAGVVRSYSVEWDLAPYPPKFKALTLQAFDGKGSLNQHIYYFKSQTGNVVANDVILVRLFIGHSEGTRL